MYYYRGIFFDNICFSVDMVRLKLDFCTEERIKKFGDYLSFVPMTPEAGLSLSGVKYPLDRYTLRQGESICQSNEITEMIAKVEIFTGKLVVFETRD